MVSAFLLPQVAVDLQKCGDQVVRVATSRAKSGVFSRIAGTTRWRNVSATSMRLLRNTFGNTRESMSADAVLPASSVANTFIGVVQVLVVEQRKERDARAGSAMPTRGARVARVDAIADAHAGGDVGGRRAEHHELAAAVVDVVVHREHRDARRLQPDAHRCAGEDASVRRP